MKYGFVYIWFDRKHKRYYVGCHWGTVNDGYICSSNWMRNSYKRRPDDFKRRILKTNLTSKNEMFLEELRYLSMMKPDEIKLRYYNLNIKNDNIRWLADPLKTLNASEKMSKAKKGRPSNFKGKKMSDEARAKISAARKKQSPPMLGKTHSDATKLKMSNSKKKKVT